MCRATLLAILLLPPALLRAADHWPQWRGPEGTGVVRQGEVPLVWDEQRNVLWKCPLPEWGTSTPAIWGDAIFVTAHQGDRLLLLRIDKQGKVVWTRDAGRGTAPREAAKRSTQKFHDLHNLASPSPVTDGERVVVHFGNGDLAAFDFAGKEIWKRNLAQDYGDYSIWWGHANSPVLVGGNVISVCMQDSLADLRPQAVESYLVAHDVRDGHVRWKVPRMTGAPSEQGDSYTTPLAIKLGDSLQLVVMGGNQLDAYDPASGRAMWKLTGLVGGRTVTGPTAANGLIYTTRGMRGPLLAVKPPAISGAQAPGKGGKGAAVVELTDRDIVWKYDEGTPDTCCPVVWDTLLYTVSDDGIARCLDALTGHLRWKQRLPGKYKASPVAIAGRILFLNTEGLCTIVAAAPRFDRLTENKLDDETIASPAASGGRLYLRGRKSLYCIGLTTLPTE